MSGERRAVVLAFVFHFLVLASYYVLRPIRDEIGAAGGLESLSWLFTATLVAMLLANVAFSAAAARLSRRQFIPLAYRFFIVTLALFWVLMQAATGDAAAWVGRAFYVWVSVFNLFVVSVFWGFMADLFSAEQGKRLFGQIAVGGTLGAILGGAVTAGLVQHVGSATLLVVSALLLEGAARCVKRFPATVGIAVGGASAPTRKASNSAAGASAATPVGAEAPPTAASSAFPVAAEAAPTGSPQSIPKPEWPLGGTFWSGIAHVFRSPYLLGICAFMLLHSVTATLVYFQQADIAGRAFEDRGARTAFFAQLDVAVNALTLLVQLFLTGRILKRLGAGLTLAVLPAISLVGFVAVATMPVLGVLAAFQVLRRAANYALSKPAREVLFTVLPREDKYKAKAFTDTFVYRAGDQLGAWLYPALRALGFGLAGVSWLAVPLAAAWCSLSLWLGRRQARLAEAEESPAPPREFARAEALASR